jgi:beta-lactamase regulating signal transducer with metallopeptidase domain
MTLLLASLAGAALVLGLGLAATAMLRRQSAALRHAVLAATISAATLMPAFEWLLPQIPVLRMQAAAGFVTSGLTLESDVPAAPAGHTAPAPRAFPWPAALGLAWLAGTLVTFAGLVTGLARLARLRARCSPADDAWRGLADELARARGVRRPVALLQSDDPSLLVTCGVLRPAIILPAGAPAWPDDRRRVVLRHELAHVVRHDAAIQLAGEALRVVQWLNPLVWIACRRLRQESEYACDDAVLSDGVEAADYATHLLDVARDLSGHHAAWTAAPAIAHPSTLERRVIAMLEQNRNRAPLDRRGWALAALAALVISLPVAAAGIASGGTRGHAGRCRRRECDRAGGVHRRGCPPRGHVRDTGLRDRRRPGAGSVRRHDARRGGHADRPPGWHIEDRQCRRVGTIRVPRRGSLPLLADGAAGRLRHGQRGADGGARHSAPLHDHDAARHAPGDHLGGVRRGQPGAAVAQRRAAAAPARRAPEQHLPPPSTRRSPSASEAACARRGKSVT